VGAHGQGERARLRRRRVTRAAFLLLTAALAAAVAVLVTGPPAPIPLAVASHPGTWRGAFHIHTTRSDGTLPKARVAAAAARAGLRFAIFTDHGDGMTLPDPPAYIDDVLCIDGVEISTNDGHYVALDLPAAPYPLGGDAEAVVEDVARLGGFGIVAHPTSPRDELAWRDWAVPIDGIEWINADSEWRDETWPMLARTFADYLWRPAGALARLLNRPDEALAIWDRLNEQRPVVGLAGHDAHGGFGPERGAAGGSRRVHVPSYDASFRTFSLYVRTGVPATGDADADARMLLQALRAGRVFTAIDALASPAALDFSAAAGDVRAHIGATMPAGSGPVRYQVQATVPPGARTRLLRGGEVVAAAEGGVLDHIDPAPGAYRVEIHLPGGHSRSAVPWIVSNPIYHFGPARAPDPDRVGDDEGREATSIDPAGWRIESSPGSSGGTVIDRGRISLLFRLSAERMESPFVALGAPLAGLSARTEEIVFTGWAEEPMRVSVQLRFAEHGDRWRTSVYLDATPRDVRLPIDRLRPVGPAGPRPPVDRATSLLFVVDLTNTSEGSAGRFTVSNVRLEAAR
jgi:hypothetical protein